MTLPRWWQRWPERLDAELDELGRRGYDPVVDEDARSAGVIRLRLTVPARVAPVPGHLEVVFPDTYPYLRATVTAAELDLPRHQVPFAEAVLCYLGRGTDNWRADNLLGAVLDEQLPRVLLAADPATDPAVVAETEEHQGEPLASYFPYERGAALLVDSAWRLPPEAAGGSLLLGLPHPATDGRSLVNGAVLEVRDGGGAVVARADDALIELFPDRIEGVWVRRPRPPMELDAVAFDAELVSDHLIGRSNLRRWGTHQRVAVVGVVFRDEVAWRHHADTWVFLVRTGPAKPTPGQPRVDGRYFALGSPAGRADLWSRTPELRPLAARTVAVVGLGGVGAPAAMELARAGVGELRLLEPDTVDAATAVRWPFGFSAAGRAKIDAIAQWVTRDHPYTRVSAAGWKIGSLPEQDGERVDELGELDALMDGADLVLDATAEPGIHHLLSDLAAERGLPYVYAHATPGGWGGLAARVRPPPSGSGCWGGLAARVRPPRSGSGCWGGLAARVRPPRSGSGCWGCLQRHHSDGAVPLPPADPDGTVQPYGCADPTFTAAGFDLAPVANAAVRLVVSTLCGGADGAYPDCDWDVAVVTLRRDGRAVPGEWATHPLVAHPACPRCAAA